MGPYCLQYMLHMNIHNREEQRKRVITGGLTAKEKTKLYLHGISLFSHFTYLLFCLLAL